MNTFDFIQTFSRKAGLPSKRSDELVNLGFQELKRRADILES